MSLNVNVIVDKFRQLADAHPNINSFGYGPISNLDGFEMTYPYLWLRNDVSHTLVYSEDNKYQAVEFQFILRVGDKVNNQPNVYRANGENSNNGLDIMGDTFRILMDIFNSMMMNTLGLFDDLELINDVDIEPFFHEDTGDVNGHQATITLRIKNDGKCYSPLVENF